MLSPIIAPREAAAITASKGNLCSDASTPPTITTVSPGNMNPTKIDDSAAGTMNTNTNAAIPESPKT